MWFHCFVVILDDGLWNVAAESDTDFINIILGCEISHLSNDQVMEILKISGITVFNIYQKVTKLGEGIG